MAASLQNLSSLLSEKPMGDITCPLCQKRFNIDQAIKSGEVRMLGRDAQGRINLKHCTFCDANIIWDPKTGEVFEKDVFDKSKIVK